MEETHFSFVMKLIFLPKFIRQFKKLPKSVQQAASQKEALLRKNPFHPSLKTHKLKGRLAGYWSFWINYEHRVIFEFLDPKIILVYEIGNHKIYDG